MVMCAENAMAGPNTAPRQRVASITTGSSGELPADDVAVALKLRSLDRRRFPGTDGRRQRLQLIPNQSSFIGQNQTRPFESTMRRRRTSTPFSTRRKLQPFAPNLILL